MKTFLKNQNNGIIAVISEEDAKLPKNDPRVRVFTFCPDDWPSKYPETKKIYTGTHSALKQLKKNDVHVVDLSDYHGGHIEWSGFVPNSNQEETSYSFIGTYAEAAHAFR